MLGHSSLKQTQHYAKIKEKIFSEKMSKLRTKLSTVKSIIEDAEMKEKQVVFN